MRKIIADSLWCHIGLFVGAISLLTLLLFFKVASPIAFVCIGVSYVFLLINSAMNIADFEMSEIGVLVKDYENGRFYKIETFE